MKNRRIYRRLPCDVPVIAVAKKEFVYGRVLDLGLGGVRILLEKPLQADQLTLTPKRFYNEGEECIPLPFTVAWTPDSLAMGLRFSGTTKDFWRSWLAGYLPAHDLLDQRALVRVRLGRPTVLTRDRDRIEGDLLDLSLGGIRFSSATELFPGEVLAVDLTPELGNSEELELMVVRVEQADVNGFYGAKFLEVSEAHKERLNRALRARLNCSS